MRPVKYFWSSASIQHLSECSSLFYSNAGLISAWILLRVNASALMWYLRGVVGVSSAPSV